MSGRGKALVFFVISFFSVEKKICEVNVVKSTARRGGFSLLLHLRKIKKCFLFSRYDNYNYKLVARDLLNPCTLMATIQKEI